MPSVQIKDVPAETHAVLRRRAAAAGQSLQEYLRTRLIDLEVVSVLRRRVLAGRLEPGRTERALAELADLPMQRATHLPLLPRIWSLRDDLSAYDAAHVALAEALDVELLTADVRLARAPGIRCAVFVSS